MKPRLHVYLDDELSDRLDALARRPGSSKSAIVADALRHYLARGAAAEIDAVLKARLDRIGRQLARLERDQQVVLESLALFIRYQLTVTAPLPDADHMAARALGQGRFNSFVEQVGRRLAGGKSLTRDVLGRISTAGIVEPDGPFQEIRE
jgi:predicted transcriptional regulator